MEYVGVALIFGLIGFVVSRLIDKAQADPMIPPHNPKADGPRSDGNQEP